MTSRKSGHPSKEETTPHHGGRGRGRFSLGDTDVSYGLIGREWVRPWVTGDALGTLRLLELAMGGRGSSRLRLAGWRGGFAGQLALPVEMPREPNGNAPSVSLFGSESKLRPTPESIPGGAREGASELGFAVWRSGSKCRQREWVQKSDSLRNSIPGALGRSPALRQARSDNYI